ncbi:MAG: response regulator [Polyangiaceae bacterium]|jgi:CheY-like chemotaxis protein
MHPPIDLESKPMVVIVADDDDDYRALVVAALQADGHATLEAHDGQELLALLEQANDGEPSLRPDVLITDVKMPKLSGLGVLEALRGAHWRLPVVVMTVLSDDSIHTVAMRLGAIGVLRKPFDTDDMLTALRNARTVTARHGAW